MAYILLWSKQSKTFIFVEVVNAWKTAFRVKPCFCPFVDFRPARQARAIEAHVVCPERIHVQIDRVLKRMRKALVVVLGNTEDKPDERTGSLASTHACAQSIARVNASVTRP